MDVKRDEEDDYLTAFQIFKSIIKTLEDNKCVSSVSACQDVIRSLDTINQNLEILVVPFTKIFTEESCEIILEILPFFQEFLTAQYFETIHEWTTFKNWIPIDFFILLLTKSQKTHEFDYKSLDVLLKVYESKVSVIHHNTLIEVFEAILGLIPNSKNSKYYQKITKYLYRLLEIHLVQYKSSHAISITNPYVCESQSEEISKSYSHSVQFLKVYTKLLSHFINRINYEIKSNTRSYISIQFYVNCTRIFLKNSPLCLFCEKSILEYIEHQILPISLDLIDCKGNLNRKNGTFSFGLRLYFDIYTIIGPVKKFQPIFASIYCHLLSINCNMKDRKNRELMLQIIESIRYCIATGETPLIRLASYSLCEFVKSTRENIEKFENAFEIFDEDKLQSSKKLDLKSGPEFNLSHVQINHQSKELLSRLFQEFYVKHADLNSEGQIERFIIKISSDISEINRNLPFLAIIPLIILNFQVFGLDQTDYLISDEFMKRKFEIFKKHIFGLHDDDNEKLYDYFNIVHKLNFIDPIFPPTSYKSTKKNCYFLEYLSNHYFFKLIDLLRSEFIMTKTQIPLTRRINYVKNFLTLHINMILNLFEEIVDHLVSTYRQKNRQIILRKVRSIFSRINSNPCDDSTTDAICENPIKEIISSSEENSLPLCDLLINLRSLALITNKFEMKKETGFIIRILGTTLFFSSLQELENQVEYCLNSSQVLGFETLMKLSFEISKIAPDVALPEIFKVCRFISVIENYYFSSSRCNQNKSSDYSYDYMAKKNAEMISNSFEDLLRNINCYHQVTKLSKSLTVKETGTVIVHFSRLLDKFFEDFISIRSSEVNRINFLSNLAEAVNFELYTRVKCQMHLENVIKKPTKTTNLRDLYDMRFSSNLTVNLIIELQSIIDNKTPTLFNRLCESLMAVLSNQEFSVSFRLSAWHIISRELMEIAAGTIRANDDKSETNEVLNISSFDQPIRKKAVSVLSEGISILLANIPDAMLEKLFLTETFLDTFVKIQETSTDFNLTIATLILTSVSELIENFPTKIFSGWKSIFSIVQGLNKDLFFDPNSSEANSTLETVHINESVIRHIDNIFNIYFKNSDKNFIYANRDLLFECMQKLIHKRDEKIPMRTSLLSLDKQDKHGVFSSTTSITMNHDIGQDPNEQTDTEALFESETAKTPLLTYKILSSTLLIHLDNYLNLIADEGYKSLRSRPEENINSIFARKSIGNNDKINLFLSYNFGGYSIESLELPVIDKSNFDISTDFPIRVSSELNKGSFINPDSSFHGQPKLNQYQNEWMILLRKFIFDLKYFSSISKIDYLGVIFDKIHIYFYKLCGCSVEHILSEDSKTPTTNQFKEMEKDLEFSRTDHQPEYTFPFNSNKEYMFREISSLFGRGEEVSIHFADNVITKVLLPALKFWIENSKFKSTLDELTTIRLDSDQYIIPKISPLNSVDTDAHNACPVNGSPFVDSQFMRLAIGKTVDFILRIIKESSHPFVLFLKPVRKAIVFFIWLSTFDDLHVSQSAVNACKALSSILRDPQKLDVIKKLLDYHLFPLERLIIVYQKAQDNIYGNHADLRLYQDAYQLSKSEQSEEIHLNYLMTVLRLFSVTTLSQESEVIPDKLYQKIKQSYIRIKLKDYGSPGQYYRSSLMSILNGLNNLLTIMTITQSDDPAYLNLLDYVYSTTYKFDLRPGLRVFLQNAFSLKYPVTLCNLNSQIVRQITNLLPVKSPQMLIDYASIVKSVKMDIRKKFINDEIPQSKRIQLSFSCNDFPKQLIYSDWPCSIITDKSLANRKNVEAVLVCLMKMTQCILYIQVNLSDNKSIDLLRSQKRRNQIKESANEVAPENNPDFKETLTYFRRQKLYNRLPDLAKFSDIKSLPDISSDGQYRTILMIKSLESSDLPDNLKVLLERRNLLQECLDCLVMRICKELPDYCDNILEDLIPELILTCSNSIVIGHLEKIINKLMSSSDCAKTCIET